MQEHLKHQNDSKDFTEYLNDMDYVYNNTEEKYKPNKKSKTLIVFDLISMLSNKKFNLIVTEVFFRGRKLNISYAFISCAKNIRLNSMHYFIIKILNKRELQQMPFNHSSDIDSGNFEYLQKMHWNTIFLFDATLPSDDPLHCKESFRKNIKS